MNNLYKQVVEWLKYYDDFVIGYPIKGSDKWIYVNRRGFIYVSDKGDVQNNPLSFNIG
jgi:hypothetical protein